MDTERLFSAFPQLETNRLVLRQLVPSDDKAVFEVFRHPEVTRYYDQETFLSIEPAQAFVDSCIKRFYDRRGIRWGIISKNSSKLIGTCGLHNLIDRHHRAEVGYDLAPEFWRAGIMSEAIAEVLKFCFEDIHFNRIEALCMTGNTASVGLLKKLNFQSEGIVRQYAYWKGQYRDLILLSSLKSDYC